MEIYEIIDMIGEGSYGVVYKGKHRTTGEVFAIKRINLAGSTNGIPCTTIREISLLKELKHPNIVKLLDVFDNSDFLFMVLEFVSMDLGKFIEISSKEKQCDLTFIQNTLYQIAKAIFFCHSHRIIHRDLCPNNILINLDGTVKVADFGLARTYSLPCKCYSQNIVTLPYRAPEILLELDMYTCGIDIWSLGCIFAELITFQKLFNGFSETSLLYQIFLIMGTPNEENWPGITTNRNFKMLSIPNNTKFRLFEKFNYFDESGLDLLHQMLIYNPAQRISAKKILEHEFFAKVFHN